MAFIFTCVLVKDYATLKLYLLKRLTFFPVFAIIFYMALCIVIFLVQLLMCIAILAGFMIGIRAGWYARNNRDPALALTTPPQNDKIVEEKAKKVLDAMKARIENLG